MKKLLVFAIAILGFSAVSFGQVSASAASSATIITPLTIAKTTNTTASDLNFGNIASTLAAGTVTVDPNGGRTALNGATLPTGNLGVPTAASFTVTGLANSIYSIALPDDFTIEGPSGSAPMTVGSFTSSPTVAAGGVLTGGTQVLKVGATLSVNASQAAGLYTNSSALTVTVNYN